MELKKIQELINLMEQTDTKRLAIKQGEFEIELERESKRDQPNLHGTPVAINPMREELDQHRAQASPSHQEDEPDRQGQYVASPMVGTYYSSPTPDDPPFVSEGDVVKKGDVLCIVEAMKVMNEVKAEVEGTVAKILIENGHPVEFGTRLFEIN